MVHSIIVSSSDTLQRKITCRSTTYSKRRDRALGKNDIDERRENRRRKEAELSASTNVLLARIGIDSVFYSKKTSKSYALKAT